MMFKEGELELLAYNIETILAEKYETVIRRSTLNTRVRDFYDIYILVNTRREQINIEILKQAIGITAMKRESTESINDSARILNILVVDEELQRKWKLYRKEYAYAKEVEWEDVVKAVIWISGL